MTANHIAQLRVLLWKNWLFSVRSKRATCLQLLAPLIFTFLLRLLQCLPSGLADVSHPKSEKVGVLPKCTPWNGKPCTTLLVGIAIEFGQFAKWNSCMQKVTEGVASASGLELGRDVQIWNNPGNPDVLNATFEHLLHYPNQTAHVLLFGMYNVNSRGVENYPSTLNTWCHIDEKDPERSSLSYIIIYNGTRQPLISQLYFPENRHPDGRNELQLLVDQVFMRLISGKDIKIEASVQGFPVVHQHESVTREGTAAIIFFYCGLTFQFVMMLQSIVLEKDLKLRQGLKLIGMFDSMYWLAWVISGVFIATVSVASQLAVGYACNLLFFTNTSFLVNFITLMVYSCSLISVAFLASAFIRTLSRAVTVGILFYVCGLFLVMVVGNSFVEALIFNYAIIPPIVPHTLSLSPAFSLTRVLADISKAFTPYNMYGYRQKTYRESKKKDGEYARAILAFIVYSGWYTWSHLFVHQAVRQFSTVKGKRIYFLPPAIDAIYWLLSTSAIYGVVFWYLDKVFPGDQGIPEKWYFPFQLSYWFESCKGQSRRRYPRRRLFRSISAMSLSSIVSSESEREEEMQQLCCTILHAPVLVFLPVVSVMASVCFFCAFLLPWKKQPSLVIDGLGKCFRQSTLCCCRKKPGIKAVDDLSLEVCNGELLVLLGHNGAGKSTTINILTGLILPDQGNAYMHNLSIRSDMRKIRSFLGICPQHDLLWDDLTAWEHVELFASLKGLSSSAAKLAIVDMLRGVDLDKVMDHRVSTFSGGMKRRLSVALSLVGDPKVVFLDEPTTGMDPCVRRKVWDLILSVKKDRVIVMTTHSMEEADVLGDQIAIMARGGLVAYGSSVALKNQYAGYDISFVVKEDNLSALQDLVSELLPGADLKEEPQPMERGLLLVYNVPPRSIDDIGPFVKAVQERAGSYLVDFSVSQTTLEDVFINVTNAYAAETWSSSR